jgi:hypothetical protein
MNKEGMNGFGHGLLYSRALYQYFAGVTDRNPETLTEVGSFFSEIRCRNYSIGTCVNDYMATLLRALAPKTQSYLMFL